MSGGQGEAEAVVLHALLPSLEAEGFQVLLNPPRTLLPDFLRRFMPDAVALKPDRKIAFEVVRRPANGTSKLQQLRQSIAMQPGWELRVIYAPQMAVDRALPPMPRDVVEDALRRLPRVLDDAGPVPALLTAWSVLEAAARLAVSHDLATPRSPAALLEVLAAGGYVTPDQADVLRRIARARNEAAHGGLDTTWDGEHLAELMRVTRFLLDQVPERSESDVVPALQDRLNP